MYREVSSPGFTDGSSGLGSLLDTTIRVPPAAPGALVAAAPGAGAAPGAVVAAAPGAVVVAPAAAGTRVVAAWAGAPVAGATVAGAAAAGVAPAVGAGVDWQAASRASAAAIPPSVTDRKRRRLTAPICGGQASFRA